MRFNVKALAVAMGLFWGVSVFLLTWWMIFVWGPSGATTFLGLFYLGYSISALGSLVGFVWAFVDGFIVGAIFGWLYNYMATRFESTEAS